MKGVEAEEIPLLLVTPRARIPLPLRYLPRLPVREAWIGLPIDRYAMGKVDHPDTGWGLRGCRAVINDEEGGGDDLCV